MQKIQDAAIKGYNIYYLSIIKDSITKDYNVILLPSKPEKNLDLNAIKKEYNTILLLMSMCTFKF
ncbi:hypothetical protein AGMMS49921_08470 [Endomicrobiia bacterium]|nr:hypothetical protein AGMMS49921_08470 [Endomicrobiia bacterium]